MFNGYKTYIVACVFLVGAVASVSMDILSASQAVVIIEVALGLAGLRHGMQTGT